MPVCSTSWNSFDYILKTTGQEEIYWIKQMKTYMVYIIQITFIWAKAFYNLKLSLKKYWNP